MSRKPILCLDFDGVLHGYQSGWQGVGRCPDPPVPGAADFLYEAVKHFRVMIHSSRSKSIRGRLAMKAYVREHLDTWLTFHPDLRTHDRVSDMIEWPWFKPPALLTIDDRALTFDGTWPEMAALQAFRPWNKKASQHSPDTREGSKTEGRGRPHSNPKDTSL